MEHLMIQKLSEQLWWARTFEYHNMEKQIMEILDEIDKK